MAQMLSNLPLGAKVKFGKFLNADLIWIVADKNHTGYPANSVTLLAERIIYEMAFDARESSEGGNTHYGYSNLRQWLNSNAAAGKWYSSQHTADVSPASSEVVDGVTYSTWAGFLNGFSDKERGAILPTTLSYEEDDSYLSCVDNVFLIGSNEVGISLSMPNQVKLSLFNIDTDTRKAGYTIAYRILKPSYAADTIGKYWLRDNSGSTAKNLFEQSGVASSGRPDSARGVRPLTNVTSSIDVSDTTDSDGCYTIIWNTAPTAPSPINVPTIYGGKSNSISWGRATDLDGDALTYVLECSINDGAYTQIYSGASTTYAHLVPFGTIRVAYRVKATDTVGESSAYQTSTTVTVINNNAPVISGADSNLGVKTDGFFGSYQINDADGDTVTVTEAIDGVQIRALVVTPGMLTTYNISDNTWLTLPNGSHTFTITATDGIDTSVRTYTFTKLVESFTIQNAAPWDASSRPSRIMLVITRNIPSGAKFKVEVCNNGYDANPTWESATAAVTSGLVHTFFNNVCSANKWAVLVRVTVERNGASGACYVSAIGGNFE